MTPLGHEGSPLVAGDVHTHIWAEDHVSSEFMCDLERVWPAGKEIRADVEAHAGHATGAARSVVLAFDARQSGFVVPDEFVAEYVARDPLRLVGFCSVDPQREDAETRLRRAVEDLGLRGLKLAPTYQGFDPLSLKAFTFYEKVAALGLPVVWHQGTTFVRTAQMAYALPHQIDSVAIRFPEMRIVIAHLGHPWIDECIAVIRKHPNVYADISALVGRPIQFRAGLISAGEYGCPNKLLFGSDFPFAHIDETVRQLRTWLVDESSPAPLKDAIEGVLGQDPLAVLGL
jgi:hypothetical protein